MGDDIKLDVVDHVTTTADTAEPESYETMSPPTSLEDSIYEPVEPKVSQEPKVPPEPAEDPQGYLVPKPNILRKSSPGIARKSRQGNKTGNATTKDVYSVYEDLWDFKKPEQHADCKDETHSYLKNNDDPVYDDVDTVIPSNLPLGTKIISTSERGSIYNANEVIINDGRYMIPSRQWDSDSDALESDFEDDAEAPNYFGENLDALYENIENRKLVSPTPRTMQFNVIFDEDEHAPKRVLSGCLPFAKPPKSQLPEKSFDDEGSPVYVDPNKLGEKEPVMPPVSLGLSGDEATRYEIVNKIVETEATYKRYLNQLVEIEKESRERKLLEADKLDLIFCSLQKILQTHEMFSVALAARMNEWTIEGKLGDIICASFSKTTTTMAYTDFVNNFLTAIDTFRAACKSNTVFSQFMQAKINNIEPETSFHHLILKPFERFPEFIILTQDLLEVTPVGHADRVSLQLSLTQLECMAELINSRRKESEMKSYLKYLDTQISQLNKPLSSSGRLFIRQDDMIHCLLDGVSVVGTKKLRLVLLSDMLLCLSPVGKKKRIVPGLLNLPKHKFKLKWNVPLSDVEFIEYGTGVSVAAGKYGTTTTYSEQGKYRQATAEIQKHIEDLQHDLAVIGQIAGLASSLRGGHQILDQHKVERWYKSVENTITEELKAINMFWLELSLPTKSGQHNYVFHLSSPTVKEEWQADAMNTKLSLESRNNPGWYLPEEDITGGLSILRRNMPLLAEYYDLFIFNTRSRVEHTICYPVEAANISTVMAARGLGYHVWISARGEMQGNVSVVRFERNACAPRVVESFNVCPGTVYSMAHIPAMNSRPDQSADKYQTKYGFPFPTVWLGSHSSKIFIYDAESEDRSRPLMELKLRDAPLAMRYAVKKVYVGLANGTLAIFRSNTSDHWNLVQPDILPLGRYPVAMIADVKDKLWCSSGSQIYVVSKKGDRIQRIISVDSNMKNLVKHVVNCGVGVWVSVWKKATIKLYHAETYEMIQEVNIVTPVVKMKNDVDTQVQYLSLDKICVTALLFIPGFLWVGTSAGLILLYPLPKLQGVPRVIGRACVAFHGHCGPVRSLLAIPQGEVGVDITNDDVNTGDEDPNEINRKFTMLADSEESVESDEDFYFVDDNKFPSPKKKKGTRPNARLGSQKLKVSVKGPEEASVSSEVAAEPASENGDSDDFNITKPDDFARMMATFGGFNQNRSSTVRSYKNKLFDATHPEDRDREVAKLDGDKMPETNAAPDIGDVGEKTGVSKEHDEGANVDDTAPVDSCSQDISSGLTHRSDSGKSNSSSGSTASLENRIYVNISTVMTNGDKEEEINAYEKSEAGSTDTHREEEKDLSGTKQSTEDVRHTDLGASEPGEQKSRSLKKAKKTRTSSRKNKNSSSQESSKSSSPSKSLERSQETYITVLPDPKNGSDGNDTKASSETDSQTDSQIGKTEISRSKCLSYLVVSAGEGHADLRLKVKSKQELKKDAQSMFLIWRVNSKV
ncbi:rho guanine nucleotide exchange factor 10-like isoform X2 [Dendronephthya gigantea]|uniref:rho guanine nucleotide exchange factor 10-like isoform X2 n=1 Tax=Dendronephthya gigantea TaxID=151771 RepID=UPI00106AB06A|nr:rho guanine nucleotide exchange factor 10-like isoform X2 [Dendronephthya gigantea]